MTAYASGVTLTSTAASDIMNSVGGDTFVFKEAAGHDVIHDFKAGDSAGHDVIQIIRRSPPTSRILRCTSSGMTPH